MNVIKPTRTLLLAAAVILAALAGCETTNSSSQKAMLTSAGFRMRTPETQQQRELYSAAPAYVLQRGSINGRTFYAYKDEKQGVAYVGGDAEYQRFKQLAAQQRLAEEKYAASEMQSSQLYYSAWRGRSNWWGF